MPADLPATTQEIFLQTNADNPTSAIKSSRNSTAAGTISFVEGDKTLIRVILMEYDYTTGDIYAGVKKLSGETISAKLTTSNDATILATATSWSDINTQGGIGNKYRIDCGKTADLDGEYVVLARWTDGSTYVPQKEEKHVFWFSTSAGSMPPNLDGHVHHVVNLGSGDKPISELSGVINAVDGFSTSVVTGFSDGSIEVTTPDDKFRTVTPTRPSTSNTSVLQIHQTQVGKNEENALEATMDLSSTSAITTALSGVDSVEVKLVIQVLQSSNTLEKTVAVQDVTLYRDFSTV